MLGDRKLFKPEHYTKAKGILPIIIDNYFHEKMIIGLGGESGTGKTEIASIIQEQLWNTYKIRCKIIHIDDYYSTPWQDRNKIRKKKGINCVGLKEIKWNDLDNIAKTFKSKKLILRVQRIHKYTNSIEYVQTANKNIDILILEGIYANHLKMADINIFLDGTFRQTKNFRLERKKEKQSSFRNRVLSKEHKEAQKLKNNVDFIIPFKVENE